MKAAAEKLESFGVPYEISIVSAHRTPKRMISYAEEAKDRGPRNNPSQELGEEVPRKLVPRELLPPEEG